MTYIQDFIFSRLTGYATVAAKVERRVYYVKMPDNAPFPCITYQILSGNNEESRDGSSKLRSPIIGIDSWAKTALGAMELSEAVKNALHGYKGTFGTVIVQNILEWSEVDLFDSDIDVFHMAASAKVWYYDNS